MKKARYNRISTPQQNIERQLIKSHPNEIIYNDVVSGSVPFGKREKGSLLIEDIKSGNIDYVSVSSIDRAGRNLQDIINTISFFNKNNITLRVDNLGIESMIDGKKNPTFDLIISVMANVAVMERDALLERQKEGIAIAKANGTYKGRVKGSVIPTDEYLLKYKNVVKLLNEKFSLRKTAKLCDVSLGTVQKVKSLIIS
jgi:DNA invertase Pin-like site-specific DNA recombinase